MSFSKEMNKWVAQHSRLARRALTVAMVIWFVLGLVLVDKIDPLLFVGLWVPPGALVTFFCYRW